MKPNYSFQKRQKELEKKKKKAEKLARKAAGVDSGTPEDGTAEVGEDGQQVAGAEPVAPEALPPAQA